MTITITALERPPDGGRDLARDTPIILHLASIRLGLLPEDLPARPTSGPSQTSWPSFPALPDLKRSLVFRNRKKDSSFSEEKEAKRLLISPQLWRSVGPGVRHAGRKKIIAGPCRFPVFPFVVPMPGRQNGTHKESKQCG